jgi:hypothetical protein
LIRFVIPAATAARFTSCPSALCVFETNGFLANRCRAKRIEEIRTAIDAAQAPEPTATRERQAPFDGYRCPTWRYGRLRITAHPGTETQ